jgi:hypothetical protein
VSTFDLITRIRADGSQATTEFGRVENAMKKIGLAVGAAFGARQLLDWGVALFQVGIESEAFGRKYRAVFGDNTAALDAWVEANHQAFGVATDEVQGYLAQIGNLLTGMGMATDEAGAQAVEVLELAGAWSAWSGGQITVQDASDKLVRGMMGQTRGLIELGLKVTEQEVAARMAAEGLDQLAGAEGSRAQQQVMWTLIQEKSTTAVGAYGEALGGAYGSAQEFRAAIDEIKDALGGLVVELAPVVSVVADLGSQLADVIGPTDTAQMTAKWEQLSSAITGGGQGAADALTSLLQAWAAIGSPQIGGPAGRVLEQLRQFFTGPMSDPTIDTAGLDALALSLDQVAEAAAATFEPFATLFRGVGATGTAAAGAARPIQALSGLNEGLIGSMQGSGEAARDWVETMTELGPAIVQPIVQARLEAVSAVEGMFDDIGNAFVEFQLPDIEWADLVANAQDWAAAGRTVEEMLRDVGERGVDALLLGLGSLTPQQIALIAAQWSGQMSDLYDIFPGAHPGPGAPIEARAGGGKVLPRQAYMVGEVGPELFVPSTAGQIVPSGKTRGGSRPIHVHLNLDSREVALAIVDPMADALDRHRRGRS